MNSHITQKNGRILDIKRLGTVYHQGVPRLNQVQLRVTLAKRGYNYTHKGEGLIRCWRRNNLEWVLGFHTNMLDDVPGCWSDLSPQGGQDLQIILRSQTSFIM